MITELYRSNPILQEEKSYFHKNREFPTSRTMDAVRKLILEKVEERRTNLSELSKKMGKNHAYLQQFIHREIPKNLPEILRPLLAAALDVDENDLRPPQLKVPANGNVGSKLHQYKSGVASDQRSGSMSDSRQKSGDIVPGAALVGEADLPVFGTAEGGQGALLVTDQPVDYVVRPDPLLRVRDGYGVIITGDSMSPEHKSGSTALVNPHLPWRTGDTCIFRSTADDGSVHMCIKELVRVTDKAWHVKQHNPKKAFTLNRSEWQECHVTVGNYSRR
jgi:phage repressor protein C with HTH and peptisase S24 domain